MLNVLNNKVLDSWAVSSWIPAVDDLFFSVYKNKITVASVDLNLFLNWSWKEGKRMSTL